MAHHYAAGATLPIKWQAQNLLGLHSSATLRISHKKAQKAIYMRIKPGHNRFQKWNKATRLNKNFIFVLKLH
jgi:hypothetical protein